MIDYYQILYRGNVIIRYRQKQEVLKEAMELMEKMELTGEILKVIRELAEDKMTMVIVTHEMNFAKVETTPGLLFASDNERTREFLGKYHDLG